MEITTYFENIEEVIIADIKSAQKEILLAVAWFTNKRIFDALIERLNNDKHFTTKLVVINDNINNRIGGVDFQQFIASGGQFFFAEKNIPMHNKYMVIDSKLVITGSYNYTYLAEAINDENIIRINGGGDIIQSYIDNFDDIVSRMKPISNIKEYLSVFPPCIDMFSYNLYAIKDIYSQIEYLREMGAVAKSDELMNYISNDSIKEQAGNFEINDVIYEQWKSSYYIDRIKVDKKEIVVKFRTPISDGCFICSPGRRSAWYICPSGNNAIRKECCNIRNICINDKIILDYAEENYVYFFYTKAQRENFKDNAAEEKVNSENKLIDDHGNLIPVKQIKVAEKDILTCEVCFKNDDTEIINGMIDFVEGNGFDKKGNHWNAFKINMNLNREKV